MDRTGEVNASEYFKPLGIRDSAAGPDPKDDSVGNYTLQTLERRNLIRCGSDPKSIQRGEVDRRLAIRVFVVWTP